MSEATDSEGMRSGNSPLAARGAPGKGALVEHVLYPLAYLAMFPLYLVLAFAVRLSPVIATLITVSSLTGTLLAVEARCGVYSARRWARRRPGLDLYYSIMGVVMSGLTAVVYTHLGGWAGRMLGVGLRWDWLGVAAQCVIAILIMDVLAYWVHRAQHAREASILWRSHAVHHAAPILDVLSGAQVHVLDGLISASPLVVVAALGFSPEVVGAAYAMNLTSAGLHHARLPVRLGWFNFVTVGPETHRWHHTDEGDRTVNYGFVLAIWDILFRTFRYEGDRQPGAYGARSVEVFPESIAEHLLVGTTARAYLRLVKRPESGAAAGASEAAARESGAAVSGPGAAVEEVR